MPYLRGSWRHAMLGTRCSWLHGDERGFRNRDHRVHSSGDYKHRPPTEEHEGLRKFHRKRSGEPVELELEVRVRVVREFVTKMRSLGYRIITCSCGERHLHALAELPSRRAEVKRVVGKCKQKASHAVRDVLPGSIWSEGGEYKKINDIRHLENTYEYIRCKQEPGSVVWSHRPDENWIDHPVVGVVVMARGRKKIRVFAEAQTPASELQRRPGSDPQGPS